MADTIARSSVRAHPQNFLQAGARELGERVEILALANLAGPTKDNSFAAKLRNQGLCKQLMGFIGNYSGPSAPIGRGFDAACRARRSALSYSAAFFADASEESAFI
jgi:hypothetical protein